MDCGRVGVGDGGVEGLELEKVEMVVEGLELENEEKVVEGLELETVEMVVEGLELEKVVEDLELEKGGEGGGGSSEVEGGVSIFLVQLALQYASQ